MINNPLNPRLFVRVLKLSDEARADLLECLGGVSMTDEQLEETLIQHEKSGAAAASPPKL
ncbi:hypothetical protein JANAI62_02140 [Jannaschia pagri]|uniref:Uncharacterized protein n=1 Tax=Jannaschia pagri TaxID=2829797 RepID=A0ABQ4NGP7_9RHOB|nr:MULTISPECIES: hypothetical protein [unclassified Jannaschia]GIT90303.1 hypothetical protein JANAI61_07610 [Jannaschia sp. AI_61]GIT93591.1 hypothetical protein JANAI62_02140 [Jannaschia sp. AI_62]